MKRGLKADGTRCCTDTRRVTILAPMTRGLKAIDSSPTDHYLIVTILAPMKRGLKDHLHRLDEFREYRLQSLPR